MWVDLLLPLQVVVAAEEVVEAAEDFLQDHLRSDQQHL